jgi:hypothetical protein
MRPYELRVYTLSSKTALDFYLNQVYPNHLASFSQFGIEPHGIWMVKDSVKPQAFVLVSYAPGADPVAVVRRYMQSPEFAGEIEGWDPSNIVSVESTYLEPTASSRLA